MIDYIFLLGAPKCGTSSLFNGLALHSCICGTHPKETFALLDEDHPLAQRRTCHGISELAGTIESGPKRSDIESSLSCEESSRRARPIVLEGTTHNIYSERARREVAALGHAARSIVMLRHPSQRILSSFLYTKHNLGRIPKDLGFHTYTSWLLAGDRDKIAGAISHPVSSYVLSAELEQSDYAPLLEKWSDAVGDEQLKCVISEEYFQQTFEQVGSVLNWLELSVDELDDSRLVRANRTRSIKHPGIQRFARWMNSKVRSTEVLRPLKNLYFALQTQNSGTDEVNVSEALCMLDEHFRAKIDCLYSFLGRRIEAWESPVLNDSK